MADIPRRARAYPGDIAKGYEGRGKIRAITPVGNGNHQVTFADRTAVVVSDLRSLKVADR